MATEMKDAVQDTHADVESGNYIPKKTSPTAVLEAAALLTLFSLLAINEGSIRFIRSIPSNLGREPAPIEMSPYLIFFGGLAEVIFGLFGFFVGVSAFIFSSYSTLITKICMAVQTVLGYFVFIVFIFVEPAVKAANIPGPVLTGLSLGSSRLLITMGIFTSFHFCLALQGGQFLYMARLVAACTGTDFLKQMSGNRMRACFWNGNMGLAGLWVLITGVVVQIQVGGGELAMQYMFPPNVGRLPSFTVITGLIMMGWGLVGASLALAKSAPTWYFVGTAVTYLVALFNFGIGQFGIFADRSAGGPIALHNGLVFMVVFLASYFVVQNAKDHDQ